MGQVQRIFVNSDTQIAQETKVKRNMVMMDGTQTGSEGGKVRREEGK